MIYVFILVALVLILYKRWTDIYSYWESKGIPALKATFPFGSTTDFLSLNNYLGHAMDKMYKKGAPHPYIGVIDMRWTYLLIRDPEVISLILSKEFSHFRDRSGIDMPEHDPLIQHLFTLEGERWRALRVKLSPTFTSGKIKAMFPLFISCAESLNSIVESKFGSLLDVKDTAARFTTDVICSCAFGLEVDSTRNGDNNFRKIGDNFFKVTALRHYSFTLIKIYPELMNLMKLRFTPKNVEDFILKVIRETIEHREKNNLRRNDFLDLLMQLKNKGKLEDDTTDLEDSRHAQPFELTLELLAAQCFVFFLAGFETSSSVQTFCLYELALNPDLQERLHKEIVKVEAKHGGTTYQAFQEMQYLDMVISETMRKYPSLCFLTRRCTKTFVTPAGHRIDKGDRIVIPVWSLHHDPQFFPEPDKFDPERFSPENKSSIRPFTYLPFGEGPRICIGMRFGLLQTKVGLATVLRKYRVEPTEKTPMPPALAGASMVTMIKEKMFLKVTKREALPS